MLGLAIGIVIGVMLAFVFILIAFANSERVVSTLRKVGKVVEVPPKKAVFFSPMDAEEEAVEEIIKENEKKGLDTRLEDLE